MFEYVLLYYLLTCLLHLFWKVGVTTTRLQSTVLIKFQTANEIHQVLVLRHFLGLSYHDIVPTRQTGTATIQPFPSQETIKSQIIICQFERIHHWYLPFWVNFSKSPDLYLYLGLDLGLDPLCLSCPAVGFFTTREACHGNFAMAKPDPCRKESKKWDEKQKKKTLEVEAKNNCMTATCDCLFCKKIYYIMYMDDQLSMIYDSHLLKCRKHHRQWERNRFCSPRAPEAHARGSCLCL